MKKSVTEESKIFKLPSPVSKNSLPGRSTSNDASDIENDVSSNDERNSESDFEVDKDQKASNNKSDDNEEDGSIGDSLIKDEEEYSAEVSEFQDIEGRLDLNELWWLFTPPSADASESSKIG